MECLFIWLTLRYTISNKLNGQRITIDATYMLMFEQFLYIKRRSMDSDWARRGAFSMYQTISFIVPPINFMAPSVDPIVLTWLGNMYPAHYSNCHV